MVVVLSEEAFKSLGLHEIDESRWVRSAHRGYSLRVDPARPEMSQQRHVHIAHDKHTAAKNKQVSWNADKSRHDKKSFDVAFRSMDTAKDIARAALNLPDDALLESASRREHLHLVTRIFLDEVLDESIGTSADLMNTLCLKLID